MEQITHLRLGDQLNVWWAMLGEYVPKDAYIREIFKHIL
jgi:hypothetical protein